MSENIHIPLPSRESVVAIQVKTLLGIANHLTPYLLAPLREQAEGWKDKEELDGGVLASASVTMMAVCDRLTDIVRENPRWDMAAQSELETALKTMYEENTKLLQASTYAQRVHSAPVALFKPALGRLADGKFVAAYGEVFGTGDTLEMAIQDFNHQFKMTSQQANRVAPEEPRLNADNLTPKPKRQRKK